MVNQQEEGPHQEKREKAIFRTVQVEGKWFTLYTGFRT